MAESVATLTATATQFVWQFFILPSCYTTHVPEVWMNYAIFIAVQILIFITHAVYENRLKDTPRLLGLGVLIGIGVGLFFDIIFGKFFGLFSYGLGFGYSSLILNAVVLYGLFVADILLLQNARLVYAVLWISMITVVYEGINLFFPVWTWELVLPQITHIVVILIIYFGGAITVAAIGQIMFKYRFRLIDILLRN